MSRPRHLKKRHTPDTDFDPVVEKLWPRSRVSRNIDIINHEAGKSSFIIIVEMEISITSALLPFDTLSPGRT